MGVVMTSRCLPDRRTRLPAWAAVLLALVAASPGGAAEGMRLTVFPDEVVLTGARAEQQLVVTRLDADGRVHDLTHQAHYAAPPPGLVAVTPAGKVRARAN